MTTQQERAQLRETQTQTAMGSSYLIIELLDDIDRLTAERDTLATQFEQYKADAEMLEWLSHQGVAFGFQDIYDGNRWEIAGPYATLRIAIASEMKGQPCQAEQN